MEPTAEQAAIIARAAGGNENLLINALAGAAKTTTLVMLARALPLQPMLCIAFNKRIAEEMHKRLPGHCESATVNSIGHRAWQKVVGPRLRVQTDKSFNILKEAVGALKDRGSMKDLFPQTLRAITLAKHNGYVPGDAPFKGLVEAEDFYEVAADAIGEDLSEVQMDLIDKVLMESIRQSYNGVIDYDDQIYMSTLAGGIFPEFPVVLVDEAQDLSLLNHALLKRLVRHRIIAVGDPFQSIYAFRGAASDSMRRLQDAFGMHALGLSISFRCPRAIVMRARSRAPHMQWFNGAPEGEIISLERWSQTDVPDGAAIICRNNAPLFYMALRLIKSGRGVKLIGSDLGPGLVRLLKKVGKDGMSHEQLTKAIEDWEAEAKAKAKASRHAAIADRADCLRVFADFGTSFAEALRYAEHLFSTSGPIQLLTGHKAKGLEWDTVFHLDPWRVPSKWAAKRAAEGDTGAMEQERNLEYVIITRAKSRLVEVTMEGFHG